MLPILLWLLFETIDKANKVGTALVHLTRHPELGYEQEIVI